MKNTNPFPLTDKFVRGLDRSRSRRICDGGPDRVLGFGIRVSPTELVWIFRYSHKHRERCEPIGHVIAMSAFTARCIAAEWRCMVDLGQDPCAERDRMRKPKRAHGGSQPGWGKPRREFTKKTNTYRWRAEWVDGSATRRSKTFLTKDEAQTWVDGIVEPIRERRRKQEGFIGWPPPPHFRGIVRRSKPPVPTPPPIMPEPNAQLAAQIKRMEHTITNLAGSMAVADQRTLLRKLTGICAETRTLLQDNVLRRIASLERT